MPAIALRKYDVNDRDVNEVGDLERSARISHINKLWKYYDGDHHQPLKVEPGETDDNVIINLCGRIVDKTVEFMGVPKSIELPGGVDNVEQGGKLVTQRSSDQTALDLFWQYNDIESFVEDTVQSGSIAGHVFLRLINDAAENEVKVALLDPRLVQVFWNINNTKQLLWYRLQWQVDRRTAMRQDIVPNWMLSDAPMYDSESEWTIFEYSQTGGRKRWDLVQDEKWEYPFAPIVDWKNRRRAHEYYGATDLRQPGLNDAINFTASNIGRILKFHAHPKTVGTGFTAEQLEATSVDSFWTVPDKEAKVQNLEMQSDLSSSLNFLQLLRSEFFSQHRVLDISSVKDKLGQITNFGVRMLFSDQLDNIESKRCVYGPGLGEVSRRVLVIMNKARDMQPTVNWDDPLPVNRLEMLQAAQLEQGLGTASTQTLAQDLGRDYTAEKDKLAEEAATQLEQQVTRATALQQVGAP